MFAAVALAKPAEDKVIAPDGTTAVNGAELTERHWGRHYYYPSSYYGYGGYRRQYYYPYYSRYSIILLQYQHNRLYISEKLIDLNVLGLHR